MGWIEKGQSAAFEHQPIEGLFLLDGDFLARKLKQPWTDGKKYPTVVFPSGAQCTLRESRDPINVIVHLFSDMDVLWRDNYDEALVGAASVGSYAVWPVGENGIEVIGRRHNEHVVITYDPVDHSLSDVVFLADSEDITPSAELLDSRARAVLPPLRTTESLGLDAVAPVKFFSSDTGWTWYASEFDGEEMFFGLVNGYELEFGSFTLSELEDIRGPLGLPVERDLEYEPKTLHELAAMHEAERRRYYRNG